MADPFVWPSTFHLSRKDNPFSKAGSSAQKTLSGLNTFSTAVGSQEAGVAAWSANAIVDHKDSHVAFGMDVHFSKVSFVKLHHPKLLE